MTDRNHSNRDDETRAATRKPSSKKRMALMLIGAAVVFGGVFAVKSVMNTGMNEFFDNMPQPPASVSARAAFYAACT